MNHRSTRLYRLSAACLLAAAVLIVLPFRGAGLHLGARSVRVEATFSTEHLWIWGAGTGLLLAGLIGLVAAWRSGRRRG